jgi:hypothetical protein
LTIILAAEESAVWRRNKSAAASVARQAKVPMEDPMPDKVIRAATPRRLTRSQSTSPKWTSAGVPSTVDDDPTLPRGEVNGTLLHLQVFGDPENPR